MDKIKVLGIGSPFGDDQVGWKVVDSLQTSYCDPRITIKKLDRPHLRLLDEIGDAEIVYIIDAMKSGGLPGEIRRLTLDDINTVNLQISTHDFGVIQSLQLAAALNQLPKQVILFGIEIGEISQNDTLSEGIHHAISKTATKLIDELQRQI